VRLDIERPLGLAAGRLLVEAGSVAPSRLRPNAVAADVGREDVVMKRDQQSANHNVVALAGGLAEGAIPAVVGAGAVQDERLMTVVFWGRLDG